MSDSQVFAQLEETLTAFLAAWPAFPGVALAVRAAGLSWSGAAGFADSDNRTPLQADTPFRIASVTKTFTAAAILRLMEDEKLELDHSIVKYLEPTTLEMLQLGGYDVEQIQIEHLLRHTSGLYDFAEDPQFQARAVGNPAHRWTRAEQVRFAIEHGAPVSEPGSDYNYSDTGYVLLGEILERLTGGSLAAAYRGLLSFERIGIADTYLETLEETPHGLAGRAHQYLGEIDSTAFDPSFDLYGGGGLVSTVSDLTQFYGALFEERVFNAAATLGTMLTPSPPLMGGLGISTVPLPMEQGWGEAGFWGSAVVHLPESGVTIASTVNQARDFTLPTLKLHDDVLRLLSKG